MTKVRWVVRTATTALLGATMAGTAAAQFQTGDVFASTSNGVIKRYNAAGVLVQTLNTGVSGFTTGSAFDGAGNLYVTNFSGNSVSKFNNTGVLQGVFGSGYSTPESIVFDRAGNVYVGSTGGGIREFSATGTLLRTFNTGRVDWMDLAADQRTMYITTEGNTIQRYDLVTQTFLTPFATTGGTFALRVLGDGGVLVANTSNVLRYSSTGTILRTYTVGGASELFALNLDPDGTSFLTGDVGSGLLYRFDIASGALRQTINTGVGSNSLFGVSVFGEITQGGPPPPPTTVPEPATTALLGAGFAALGAAARQRRHRQDTSLRSA